MYVKSDSFTDRFPKNMANNLGVKAGTTGSPVKYVLCKLVKDKYRGANLTVFLTREITWPCQSNNKSSRNAVGLLAKARSELPAVSQ